MYELITITFSHYCEKARWALDRAGVDYLEHGFMPGLHFPYAALRLGRSGAGRADQVSTRFSTPLLIRGGLRVSDSTAIARYIDDRYGREELFAPTEAEALDRHYSDRLGPHSRRMVYYFGLAEPKILHDLADRNVSARQALVFRAFLPFGSRMLRRSMQIDEDSYRRSLDIVAEIADEVAERLADGRPYLCGDRFSIADLSFASMMAPAILPLENFGSALPAPEELSAEPRALVERYRAHPAGQFAAKMFREERRNQAKQASASA